MNVEILVGKFTGTAARVISTDRFGTVEVVLPSGDINYFDSWEVSAH